MFSSDLSVFVLLIFLTAAALSDAVCRRIPNLLILCALLPGGFFLGPPFLLRLIAVTALFYPFFRFHLTGAGDVKLLATVAAWSGTDRFLLFLFFSLLTASVPAALLMARRMLTDPEEEQPSEKAGGKTAGSVRIPMGPFFLAGWMLTVSMLGEFIPWQPAAAGGI